MSEKIGPYLPRMLDSNTYPVLRQLVEAADRPDREQDFIWGLDLVLNGLAT